MQQVTPPLELPKVFRIDFARSRNKYKNSDEEISNEYQKLKDGLKIERKITLEEYFNLVESEYENFLKSFEDNNPQERYFLSLREVKLTINYIKSNSKNGDIFGFVGFHLSFYIFVEKKERRIAIMKEAKTEWSSVFLPEEALKIIKKYNVHTYTDLYEIYHLRISGIFIPVEYYPDQLQDIIENPSFPFLFAEKDKSIPYYGHQVNLPVISLNIGDGYILYVSPLHDYARYFSRKTEVKLK